MAALLAGRIASNGYIQTKASSHFLHCDGHEFERIEASNVSTFIQSTVDCCGWLPSLLVDVGRGLGHDITAFLEGFP